jgi:hypothetical protein
MIAVNNGHLLAFHNLSGRPFGVLPPVFHANVSCKMGGMTTYGYARVSTDGESLAAQDVQLHAAGFAKVFAEKVSGAKSDRAEQAKVLLCPESGDVLIVTRHDRWPAAPVTRSTFSTRSARQVPLTGHQRDEALGRLATSQRQSGHDLAACSTLNDSGIRAAVTPEGPITRCMRGRLALWRKSISRLRP